MKFTKFSLYTIAVVFLFGGAAKVAALLGYPAIDNLIDEQSKRFEEAYRAAQVEAIQQ